MNKEVKNLLEQCVAEAIVETSQPESYDPKTDSFQPSPRERTDEPPKGNHLRNLDNILPTIRSLYGEQPSIQDIVDFFSTRVREQAPSRLVRQVVAVYMKSNPNFFIILPKKLQEGKLSSLAMAGLLSMGATKALPHTSMQDSDAKPKIQMADPSKELPSEKDMDAWDLADKYSANKEKTFKALRPMTDKYFGGNAMREMVKEGVVNVLEESLSEGFDPQSQAGPNATVNDPGFYANMNAQMQKMEEGEEDPVASYERGYEDGKRRKNPPKGANNAYSTGYYDGFHDKPKADAEVVRRTIKEMELSSEPHGREAQFAAAGQFDPSNFNKLG